MTTNYLICFQSHFTLNVIGMGEVALIGFGNIGQAVAIDLINSGIHPKVIDISDERLKYASSKFGLETLKLDVSKISSLNKLHGFNVIITALPGSIAYSVLSNLLKLGVNIVDVSFFPESPWPLDSIAREKGSLIIVDAGWVPGLSNIFLGYFHSKFGGLKIGRIYDGGLSLNPNAPLGLALTWSVEDLIDEYIRPARAIINGSEVSLDPLSNTGEINIPGLGIFEYFVCDGIRTMLKTFSGVQELVEYVLRYKGHLEIMSSLKKIGMLSRELFRVDGFEIPMNVLTAKILRRVLLSDIEDRVVMYIEAYSNTGVCKKFFMDIKYDHSLKMTAMAKVTGFTQSTIAKMVLDGIITGKGLMPPEAIGMNLDYFKVFREIIEGKGIKVFESQ